VALHNFVGWFVRFTCARQAGVKSTDKTEALFEAKGTETMKKIVKDTTRHR
jgi:hypothetical protein